jgi:hypothetical protein
MLLKLVNQLRRAQKAPLDEYTNVGSLDSLMVDTLGSIHRKVTCGPILVDF